MCYGPGMILRDLTVSVLFAVLALPVYGAAYAQDSAPETVPQDNPQTRQTDEAEDDYRRSQRRRDTGDIFDDIDINTGSSGSGTILGREVKAIDRLDQESRRHLNKQRAKALAEAQPGEPIDAAYEPSETAKTDEYVANQEQAAWDEMMREANNGLNGPQGQGAGTGQGDPSDQGQQGQGEQPGQDPSGGQGQSGQSGQPSTSPLRGGSASSASSILDQIKGRSRSGTAPQPGQTAGGGQSQQGQSPQSGQTQQGDASAQAQEQGDGQADAQSASDAEASADAAAQAQAEAEARATGSAAASNAAAEAAAHHETISPLERLKRDPVDRDDAGGRTSASDYLNRKKN